MEENQKKKAYDKPKVTRIRLDAQCAVLGFCKGVSGGGPAGAGCQDVFETDCQSSGS